MPYPAGTVIGTALYPSLSLYPGPDPYGPGGGLAGTAPLYLHEAGKGQY